MRALSRSRSRPQLGAAQVLDEAEIMREASRWQMWPAPGQASCAPSAKTHSSKSVHQFSWWMTELRAFCEGGEGFSVGSANRERSAGMRSAVARPFGRNLRRIWPSKS